MLAVWFTEHYGEAVVRECVEGSNRSSGRHIDQDRVLATATGQDSVTHPPGQALDLAGTQVGQRPRDAVRREVSNAGGRSMIGFRHRCCC